MVIVVILFVILVVSIACSNGGSSEDTVVRLGNQYVQLVIEGGRLRSFSDAKSGEELVSWPRSGVPWYFRIAGGTDEIIPARPYGVKVDHSSDGDVTAIISYDTQDSRGLSAILEISISTNEPWLTMQIRVENRSDKEIELIGFPGNMLVKGGDEKYMVFPLESGVLVPLGDRFDRMKVYDSLPFIFGYPSNRASMQWMGIQGAASLMVMGTDRYGSLKRFGAVPSIGGIRLVVENQVSLKPGEVVQLAPYRLIGVGSGDYSDMSMIYRDWVQERSSPDTSIMRDEVDSVEKIPLQFISLEKKQEVRPHIEELRNAHGYPEHGIRPRGDEPFAYTSYGMLLEMVQDFEKIYGEKVIPQMWSFSTMHQWPLFPVENCLEGKVFAEGTMFPAVKFEDFLTNLNDLGNPVFLYTNPTFWNERSPDADFERFFDKTGKGNRVVGGFEAGVAGDAYYVSPSLVSDYQVAQLSQLSNYKGASFATALGIMFDSSQAFGGTLWNDSILRDDPVSIIDRNPAAEYTKRYGYEGRDSYVQDRLKRDVALHEVTPEACKIGEWVGEFQTLYVDMNAGSIDLVREYPDMIEREGDSNLIPIPLYQMVYGDTQFFTIRVGAASDAILAGAGAVDSLMPEMSRRATAMFGGVGQVLYWGAVRWAGPAYETLYPRTYLVVRDNLVRKDLFGRVATYRMLDIEGKKIIDIFAIRETSWIDEKGRVVGIHWDNTSGETVDLNIATGLGQVRLGNLYGENEYVDGSLQRLKKGATVTLMGDGKLSVWDFAGSIMVDNVPWISIADSLATPEGLAVVWDGKRISIGNSTDYERRVVITWTPRLEGEIRLVPSTTVENPDGDTTIIDYSAIDEWSCVKSEHGVILSVNLPPAGIGMGRLTVPTSMATFDYVLVDAME